jgi:cob(I)alamin adenosyltransferase
LAGGKRVPKTNSRIEAYGTIDELNACIACLIEEIDQRQDRDFLHRIQSNLFTVGGYLANDNESAQCPIGDKEINLLELEIDQIDELIPPLRHFVLPGGCRSSSWAHLCRTVCRRAERCIYKINKKGGKLDPVVLKYINRLSDFFFLFARKQNNINNIEEIIWESLCL